MKKFLELRNKFTLLQLYTISFSIPTILFAVFLFTVSQYYKEVNHTMILICGICSILAFGLLIFIFLGGLEKTFYKYNNDVKKYVLNLFPKVEVLYEFKLIPHNDSDVTKMFLTLIENEGIKFYAKLLKNGNIHIIAKNIDGKIMYNSTCENYEYFKANFKFVTNDSR